MPGHGRLGSNRYERFGLLVQVGSSRFSPSDFDRKQSSPRGNNPLHASLAGALAGLLHVVAGPDHLVAVAPLAMKRPWSGFRIGLSWGIGHASGVLFVGALGVLLRTVFDVAVLSKWAEVVVGFVLVGIGVWSISQMRKVVLHKHPHEHKTLPKDQTLPPSARAFNPNSSPSKLASPHDTHVHSAPSVAPVPTIHVHLHVHTRTKSRNDASGHQTRRAHGSFWVGLIHGAAGTGHLLGVIPSLALPPLLGAAYLVSYGVAAVFAMAGFGLMMGLIGNRVSPNWLRRFMLVCGVVAIALGLYWLSTGIETLRI